jgi:hypothetical protein
MENVTMLARKEMGCIYTAEIRSSEPKSAGINILHYPHEIIRLRTVTLSTSIYLMFERRVK